MSGATRVPAAQRREMLVAAGVEIARAEGGRAVTLARVAEACGVSKPIAYRLFDSLADLLTQMERKVVADYDTVVLAALSDARRAGAAPADLLDVMTRTYLRYSVGEGAVYDTVSSARSATEEVEEHFFEIPESFSEVWKEIFGATTDDQTAILAMFQGAADNLVLAIQADAIEQKAAEDHLIALFTPLVTTQPRRRS